MTIYDDSDSAGSVSHSDPGFLARHHRAQSLREPKRTGSRSRKSSAKGLRKSKSFRESGHRRPQQCLSTQKVEHQSRKRVVGPKSNTLATPDFRDGRHNRSHSVKVMSRKDRVLHDDNNFRPRTSSMPNSDRDKKVSQNTLDPNDDLYRLRCFTVTSSGEVRARNDSLRSRSTRSVNSANSSNSLSTADYRDRVSSANSRDSTPLSDEELVSGPCRYRVMILGSSGVGKSSLMNQFMTSEYMCAYDSVTLESNQETDEKTVSVLLDGEETDISFLEKNVKAFEKEVSDIKSSTNAYVLVYSTTDRRSFDQTVDTLYLLRQLDEGRTKPVILVGNKTDLVRARVITNEEAVSIALTYDCKIIETSAGLNHHVDELLVGILKQIRLKLRHQEEAVCMRRKDLGKSCTQGPRSLLNKIFNKNRYLSKSCGNLQVL